MSETNAFEELIVIRSKGGDGTIYRQRPLVRCKDCISFYKNDNMINTNAQKGMRCKASSIDPDWFCADGERRTDDA